MFDDYKVIYCRNCEHCIFPAETAPWGTCALDKRTINKKVPRTCNKFKWKESKSYGKDKQRSYHEVMQGH